MTTLRHVHINVGEVAPVTDWYKSVLNMQEVHKFKTHLTILTVDGECQLNLEAGAPLSEPERVHLIFRVEDIDATYEKLLQAGVEFELAPTDQP